MINYPAWISPSGQELCVGDSKGWIFQKSKPGPSTTAAFPRRIETPFQLPGE
uniref:Macaca fascicularis brain cDNA clone: QtrA-15721, similar to human hypothetical protein FLJ31810 (FLJ31810), mRNA, RefSeq: NM_152570.1 n=1 Tax=Macaca fascicularis TaxID=9541 RepID=I7GNI7_MACFA|nr:unnamed protein product [Macaca fascicularis]